jgi:hypothetical protein
MKNILEEEEPKDLERGNQDKSAKSSVEIILDDFSKPLAFYRNEFE